MLLIVTCLIVAFAYLAYACYKTIPLCVKYSKYNNSLQNQGPLKKVNIRPDEFHESVIVMFCALMRSVPSLTVNQLKLQFVLDYIKSVPEEYRSHLVDVLNKYTQTESGPVFSIEKVKNGEYDAGKVIRLGAFYGNNYTCQLHKNSVEQMTLSLSEFMDADHCTYLTYLFFRIISVDGSVNLRPGESHFDSMSEFETYKWLAERLNVSNSTYSAIYRAWMKGHLEQWYIENLAPKVNFPKYDEVCDFYPGENLGDMFSEKQSQLKKIDFGSLNTEITLKLFIPTVVLFFLTIYFSSSELFDSLSLRHVLCGCLLLIMLTFTVESFLSSDTKNYKEFISSNVFSCRFRTFLLIPTLFYLEGMALCSWIDTTYQSEIFSVSRPLGNVYSSGSDLYVDLKLPLKASASDMQRQTAALDEKEKTLLNYLPYFFGGLFMYGQGDKEQELATMEVDYNDLRNWKNVNFVLTKGYYGYYHMVGYKFE